MRSTILRVEQKEDIAMHFTNFACQLDWSVKICLRHSRFAGSKDIERWGAQMGSSVVDAYQQHVAAPLLTVRNELFQTFRQVPS